MKTHRMFASYVQPDYLRVVGMANQTEKFLQQLTTLSPQERIELKGLLDHCRMSLEIFEHVRNANQQGNLMHLKEMQYRDLMVINTRYSDKEDFVQLVTKLLAIHEVIRQEIVRLEDQFAKRATRNRF